MDFFGTQVHYGPERPIDVQIGADTFYRDEDKAEQAARDLSTKIQGAVIVWALSFSEPDKNRRTVQLRRTFRHGNPTT